MKDSMLNIRTLMCDFNQALTVNDALDTPVQIGEYFMGPDRCGSCRDRPRRH